MFSISNGMLYEDQRFSTFKNDWPVDFEASAEDMAAAGFYLMQCKQTDDGFNKIFVVRCAYCELTVEWQESHEPWTLHRQQGPDCTIITGKTRKETMLDERRRRRSFVNWSKEGAPNPQALAEAGFFYAGRSDQVQCAFCEVKIFGWRSHHLPLVQHRHHSPNCWFLPTQGDLPLPPAIAPLPRLRSTGSTSRNVSTSTIMDVSSSSRVLRDREYRAPTVPVRPPLRRRRAMVVDSTAAANTEGVHHNVSATQLLDMGFSSEQIDSALQILIDRGENNDPSTLQHRVLEELLNSATNNLNSEMSQTSSGRIASSGASHTSSQTYVHGPNFPEGSVLNTRRMLVTMGSSSFDATGHETGMEWTAPEPSNSEVDPMTILSTVMAADVSSPEGLGATAAPERNDLNLTEAEIEENVKRLTSSMAEPESAASSCKVCLDLPLEVVFLPCRHLVSCARCSNRLNTCPVCRAQVVGRMKIHIA